MAEFTFVVLCISVIWCAHCVVAWPLHYYGCGCHDPCDPCKKKEKGPEGYIYASCQIMPNPSKPDLEQKLSGNVYFKQKASGGDTMYRVDITGFDTTDAHTHHGFHIHTYGTVHNACEDAGGHFNPDGVDHGAPTDEIRHVGALGNIVEDATGNVKKDGTDRLISLRGKNNILGRAVMVHAMRDDLGRGGNAESKITGNAGARLACCTIAASDGSAW